MNFRYFSEQFADIKILRYPVPAFYQLTLTQKLFVYHLSQAALAGRDILWDQNNRLNLPLRRLLEQILLHYPGPRYTHDFDQFTLYAKKVFFANGNHHHYSMEKFTPFFTPRFLRRLADTSGYGPIDPDLFRYIFDPDYMPKRVVLDPDVDVLLASANNYYQGVTQREAEQFYASGNRPGATPGLNSTLVKDPDGVIREHVWKIGGKYSAQLTRVVTALQQALPYADGPVQRDCIRLLIDYYRTGDLTLFDRYSMLWLTERTASVDFINGFIEVYGDPLARKASWESVVQIVDDQACRRTRLLADNASWFEEHAPIDPRFKRDQVIGLSARVVQAAFLGGDCHPATPIGINLPNAESIREQHGSKSVTLDNITDACDAVALSSGLLDEFAATDEEKRLARLHSALAGRLHTDLHECLGHGSGRLLPEVRQDALQSYYSTIEEARADLFALYYIMDPYLVHLGLIPSLDVARCQYDSFIRNGLLVQLTRLRPGANLEESHMRDRHLIASWAFEQGKAQDVIQCITRDGKTYFRVNDYDRLRHLFGLLLAEIQRVKSEGDLPAARHLVETYGVRVDPQLHREVLARYARLGLAPYTGFINPEYRLVLQNQRPVDVSIEYPNEFLTQMLFYATH